MRAEKRLNAFGAVLTSDEGNLTDPPLGDDLQVKIIQDYGRDFAPPTLTGIEQVAYWSYGAMLGIGQWSYDSLDAIGGIGRVAGHIAADPSLLSDTMGEGARAVWEAAEYAALGWESMSPNEKDEFILAILPDVQRRAYLVASAPFDPESYEEALTYVQNATYSLFGGVEDAYESDDPAKIADMWGRVSGHIGMEVVRRPADAEVHRIRERSRSRPPRRQHGTGQGDERAGGVSPRGEVRSAGGGNRAHAVGRLRNRKKRRGGVGSGCGTVNELV